jgi:predicted nucleotidyltransferase
VLERLLDLFGSLLRDDFDIIFSDIDLVVELNPAPVGGNLDRYFGLKQALEALFERPVDLVELSSMPNTRLKTYSKESSMSSATSLHC